MSDLAHNTPALHSLSHFNPNSFHMQSKANIPVYGVHIPVIIKFALMMLALWRAPGEPELKQWVVGVKKRGGWRRPETPRIPLVWIYDSTLIYSSRSNLHDVFFHFCHRFSIDSTQEWRSGELTMYFWNHFFASRWRASFVLSVPSAVSVWWDSWCCESGRHSPRTGYFPTPGSYHCLYLEGEFRSSVMLIILFCICQH